MIVIPLIGVTIDVAFLNSKFSFFTIAMIAVGAITFIKSSKSIAEDEIAGVLLFKKFIYDLDTGLNYVFLGFIKNTIFLYKTKNIVLDIKTQDVTHIDHSEEDESEVRGKAQPKKGNDLQGQGAIFKYSYSIDISVVVAIVKGLNFYRSTSIRTIDSAEYKPGEADWAKNICANFRSTFETLGSFLGYAEMKAKSDWTQSNIKSALRDHKQHHPTHQTQDTLFKIIRSYGLKLVDCNTTVQLSSETIKAIESIFQEAQKAIAKAGAERILGEKRVEILKNYIKEIFDEDAKIDKKLAMENAMILMDAFDNEKIIRFSGLEGDDLGILQKALATWISKNS